MIKTDIAIIGAGPAGISAAVELKKLGYENIIVFDREDEAGGTPRHCGHKGFGIFEFKTLLSGPEYSKTLEELAKNNNIEIKLKHTLYKISDNDLFFSTPEGIKKCSAKRIILALGARETPRPPRFISGTRSPNIITTGALQRFVYMHNMKPFDNAVIIGSEVVSFSALMTARHAGIKIKAVIDEDEQLNSFGILKTLSEMFLRTTVKNGVKIVSINGENKKIESITIEKNGEKETIDCEGIIFTGKFTPESSIMQKTFERFNHNNSSLYVSQIFQTTNRRFFAAGNLLRGALTAFNCFFEGRKVARFVDQSLKYDNESELMQVPIEVDENIEWYYPSLVDLNEEMKYLTKLRLNKAAKGKIKVFLNDKIVIDKFVNVKTYNNVILPAIKEPVKLTDKIRIEFHQG